MAATTIGLTTVAFGLASESGIVIQSFSLAQTAEATEVSKHNGEHLAVAFSGYCRNISMSGNCSAAVASSGIGQALALTSNSTAVSSGSYFVTDASFSEASDGFSTFDLSATAYNGLGT